MIKKKTPCGDAQCPIDATLKLISRKWVVSIIKDMYHGKTHFNEFKEDKPTLTNTVLSETLKSMEKNGLVEKIFHDNNHRSNTEYILTDRSRKLNRIIYELAIYGIEVLNCESQESGMCSNEECKKQLKDINNKSFE